LSIQRAFPAVALLGLLIGCGGEPKGLGVTETVPVPGSISVTGELRSANSRQFGPPPIQDIWNYTIAFMAPDGARVDAGQPILRFDAQELMTRIRDKRNALNEKEKEHEKQIILGRERLAELKLGVEEARAALDKAILKADIPRTLLASREYRENQLLLERARINLALREAELLKEERIQQTEVHILEREIAVLRADADQLQGWISSMTILAPTDGVVIHTTDRRNNKHSVGDNVWGGRKVIELPELSQLELHLEVPERESARIAVGQRVTFSLDAAPDRRFEGHITDLASVVHTRSVNQPAKVFDATVALSEPDPELMRPGMSVNAQILTGEAGEAGP
jgi:multidrug efflux pump subunit AcrA (membrane-fusion protein)